MTNFKKKQAIYSENIIRFKVGLNDKVKQSILRSNMDKRRLKLNQMEAFLNNLLPQLASLDSFENPKIKAIKEYMYFIQVQLKLFNLDPISYLECEAQINQEIQYYSKKIKQASQKTIQAIAPLSFVKEPTLSFGRFLQRGIEIYLRDIDFFQVWLNIEGLNKTLNKKDPDIASYSLVAMLTKFTSPSLLGDHKAFYKANLKNAKKCLPVSYNTPSFESITGLFFLTVLSISEFNIRLATRYLSLAVRMAQSLGLDKLNPLQRCKNDLGNLLNQTEAKYYSRGAKIWNSLALSYLLISSIIPSIDYLDIKPYSFSLDFNQIPLFTDSANITLNNEGFICIIKDSSRIPGIFNDIHPSFPLAIRRLLEIYFEIMLHILTVKSEHKPLDRPDLIPPSALRLPETRFYSISRELLNIRNLFSKDQKMMRKNIGSLNKIGVAEIGTEIFRRGFSLGNKFLAYFHSLPIFLLYPSAHVYPQPVQFSELEAHWLFQSSNEVVQFYLDWVDNTLLLNEYEPNKNLNEDISIKAKQPHNFTNALESPIFMQMALPIFVYLSLISLPPKTDTTKQIIYMLRHAKEQVTKTLSMLNKISHLPSLSKRFDASHALNRIVNSLDNFNLSVKTVEKFKAALKSQAD